MKTLYGEAWNNGEERLCVGEDLTLQIKSVKLEKTNSN